MEEREAGSAEWTEGARAIVPPPPRTSLACQCPTTLNSLDTTRVGGVSEVSCSLSVAFLLWDVRRSGS